MRWIGFNLLTQRSYKDPEQLRIGLFPPEFLQQELMAKCLTGIPQQPVE
jgi:hypothetical protein